MLGSSFSYHIQGEKVFLIEKKGEEKPKVVFGANIEPGKSYSQVLLANIIICVENTNAINFLLHSMK